VKKIIPYISKITTLHRSEAFKKSRFSRVNLTIFAIVFASIGGYIIYSSFAASVTTCNSVSQYGITWTFDKTYPCGQFANSDWWVAPNAGDSAVTITAMSPSFSGGHNGAEINPTGNFDVPSDSQGYDVNLDGYNAARDPALPLLAHAGDSIIKTVAQTNGCGLEGSGVWQHAPCLNTAAVLTVEPDAADRSTHFRPAYAGTDKRDFTTTQLQTNLLPSLATVSGTPGISSFARRYQRVQIDDWSGFTGRYFHAAYNYAFSDAEATTTPLRDNVSAYGAQIGDDAGDAALLLETNSSLTSKMPLLINYVQAGIDYYGMVESGTSWGGNSGGHFSGRKLPTVFAATLLNDTAMKASIAAQSPNIESAYGGEDTQTYYSPVTGRALWGRQTGSQSCEAGTYDATLSSGGTSNQGGAYDCADPDGYIDGGLNDASNGNGFYQACCTQGPFKGEALAALLLPGGKAVWDHNAFFDEEDRWVNFGYWMLPDDRTPARYGSLHNTDADGGGYHTTFADNMWTTYRAQAGNGTAAGTAWPLKKSANGRYLVDQNNTPYLMVGDSPQSAIGNLSISEADRYFADRAAHGFNTVWINLLCGSYTFCNADGTTKDGIKPFTTGSSPSNYDLSTPNETYFARADAIINSAASHGITVVLDPIETGAWLDTMVNNGATKDTNFGKYLGNRYKTFPNIIWMSGNDFQSWRTASDDAVVRAVAQGIQANDTNHIHSLELDFLTSSSLNDTNWSSMLGLNASYTYYPTYAEVLNGYNQTPTIPDFMVEANYEFEHNGGTDGGATPNLRRQEYWTMTSGATGQLYGSGHTDGIANGWLASDLDSIGVTQLGYVTSLLQNRTWYNLVPDQTHTLLTAGYGTFASSGSIVTNDYATAAKTSDGTLALAYIPSSRTVTIDMSRMSGPVTAKWYDVTAGTYATISGSPSANSGTHQFTTPGTHSDGTSDWVLVLEAGASSDNTPPTVSVTAPAAGATVSGNVTLSANASDNVAVNSVQFKVDGNNLGSTDLTSPYSVSWDSTGATNGTHTLTAVATDSSGNSTTSSSVSITVDNGNTIKIGETNVLTTDDSGNGSILLAQSATLGQTATLQSMSFYVVNATGKLRLGIYDASGPGGGPGAKKAETAEITPVAGWNTANVITPVSLPAGTFWLAYLPSSSSLSFRIDRSSGSLKYYSFTYGTMPNTFSTTTTSETGHWSFYATFSIASAGPKTGDINGDNSVNITDLSLLLSSYNQNTTQCVTNNSYKCDLSSPGDGVINIFDLSILLSHYGT